VTQAAIIALNANGVLFADIVGVSAEDLDKRFPTVRCNTVVCNPQRYYLFS